MKDGEKIYVLDTSALLTLIEDEDGADIVDTLLKRAEKGDAIIYIAFVSLTEVYYITLREQGDREAKRRVDLLKALAVRIVVTVHPGRKASLVLRGKHVLSWERQAPAWLLYRFCRAVTVYSMS